jgi:hypothetical protein
VPVSVIFERKKMINNFDEKGSGDYLEKKTPLCGGVYASDFIDPI